MRESVFYLLFIGVFFSCSKEEEQAFTDWPIIESYIMEGDSIFLKLNHQVAFITDPEYAIEDINTLQINLEVDGENYTFIPDGEGGYTAPLLGQEGDQVYTISFSFNNQQVSAYTSIPSKPVNFEISDDYYEIERIDSTSMPEMGSMPDPLDVTWDNDDGTYYLLIVENMESTLDPIRDFGDAEPPGARFRQRPNAASGTTLTPMEFQYYGTHRVILYHVNPDYAELYNESSNSSLNLKNPSSSIDNGYGIFTGLSADTLFIEVAEP